MVVDYHQLERVAQWVGHPIVDEQAKRLERYADWLEQEALPAGGLGPAEGPRIWDRHVCDALAFAVVWPGRHPTTALDVGSGAGLPGIPLSILWPTTQWTLLDRSGRRVGLLRRAVRVLRIDNAEIVQGSVETLVGSYDVVVARGVQGPAELAGPIRSLLAPGGRAAIGLTRREYEVSDEFSRWKVVEVPSQVLDGGAKILVSEPSEL